MRAARVAVLGAGVSLVLVTGFVAGALVSPSRALVGGALVSMAFLAGAIHAIGRTHTGA